MTGFVTVNVLADHSGDVLDVGVRGRIDRLIEHVIKPRD